MSAHTPGPWIVWLDDVPVPAKDAEAARDLMAKLADQTAGNVDAIAMPFTVAKAAPDLLAALRNLVSHAVEGRVFERDACIGTARAAIAKAEGGAS